MICSEKGKITDLDNWEITAEDIFLVDVGTGAYTAYEVDRGAFQAADIVDLYEAFPGLEDGSLKNHHVHTHHGMGAFFSGTDESQLNDRGKLSNYFIMLIVDTKRDKDTWVARVAFPAKIKQFVKKHMEVSDKHIEFLHNHDEFRPLVLDVPEKEKNEEGTEEKEVLCTMELNIVREAITDRQVDPFQERYKKVVAAAVPSYTAPYVGYGKVGGATGANTNHSNYNTSTGKFEKQNTGGMSPQTEFKTEEKGRTGSTKRIMDMTDAEWKEAQERHIQEDYKFEQRHARAFLNAWLGPVAVAMAKMDFDDPFIQLKKLDNAPYWKQSQELDRFGEDLREWCYSNFPGATDQEYFELLIEIDGYLRPYNYVQLIKLILDDELSGEIDNIKEDIAIDASQQVPASERGIEKHNAELNTWSGTDY